MLCKSHFLNHANWFFIESLLLLSNVSTYVHGYMLFVCVRLFLVFYRCLDLVIACVYKFTTHDVTCLRLWDFRAKQMLVMFNLEKQIEGWPGYDLFVNTVSGQNLNETVIRTKGRFSSRHLFANWMLYLKLICYSTYAATTLVFGSSCVLT